MEIQKKNLFQILCNCFKRMSHADNFMVNNFHNAILLYCGVVKNDDETLLPWQTTQICGKGTNT